MDMFIIFIVVMVSQCICVKSCQIIHFKYVQFIVYQLYFNKAVFKIYLYFIYLFLPALGLRCCARAFPSCGERGLLFIVVCGLLLAVASLIAEHGH